tara:strand:- start:20 stop:160 length:141 start_codon:yes stop_codon:yes gene_type:complete
VLGLVQKISIDDGVESFKEKKKEKILLFTSHARCPEKSNGGKSDSG